MRPYIDYDDNIDYEELRKREEQRLAAVQAKRAADDAAIDARKHKAIKILSAIVMVVCVVGAVYAATLYQASDSGIINNTKGNSFSVDLSGIVAGVEMVPGDKQSVSPAVENTGTERMYVFVRFDVATTVDNEPVYSFQTESDTWVRINTEEPGELLYYYGDADGSVEVEAGRTVTLPGTLKVDVENEIFAGLTDDDMKVRVTGCAVGTDAMGSAEEIYQEYISRGGE